MYNSAFNFLGLALASFYLGAYIFRPARSKSYASLAVNRACSSAQRCLVVTLSSVGNVRGGRILH